MEPARAEPTTRTSHSTVSAQSSTVSAGGSPSHSSDFAAAASSARAAAGAAAATVAAAAAAAPDFKSERLEMFSMRMLLCTSYRPAYQGDSLPCIQQRQGRKGHKQGIAGSQGDVAGREGKARRAGGACQWGLSAAAGGACQQGVSRVGTMAQFRQFFWHVFVNMLQK